MQLNPDRKYSIQLADDSQTMDIPWFDEVFFEKGELVKIWSERGEIVVLRKKTPGFASATGKCSTDWELVPRGKRSKDDRKKYRKRLKEVLLPEERSYLALSRWYDFLSTLNLALSLIYVGASVVLIMSSRAFPFLLMICACVFALINIDSGRSARKIELRVEASLYARQTECDRG